MNRYWDLSRKERAELTEEQVKATIIIELMEKGVVVPAKPEYIPVDEVPGPDVTLYAPSPRYSTPGFGFASPDGAAAVLSAAIDIDTEYIAGSTVRVIGTSDIEIGEVKVYSRERFAANRAIIEKNAAAKKQNDSLKSEYEVSLRKVTEASAGVWDDYYSLRSEAAANKKIIDTYNEYISTCDGNEGLAYTFLLKAYDAGTVGDAFDWFGITREVSVA